MSYDYQMTTKLDLGFKHGGLARQLSNLYAYPFVLDGTQCGSIEGFLQGVKFQGLEEQALIASLQGYEAYKTGQLGNDWKETQTLWWQGKAFPRLSREYHTLLERAYDACFDQNPAFVQALIDSGIDVLTHYMGHHDPHNSVLTEWEYIYLMYRARTKAFQGIMAET